MALQTRSNDVSRRGFLLVGGAAAGVALLGCSRTPTLESDGGAVLVYQTSTSTEAPKKANAAKLVRRRIDPHMRINGLLIEVIEDGRLRITVPNQETADLEQIKSRMAMKGRLEFLITANPVDHAGIIELAAKTEEDRVMLDEETVAGKWVDISPLEQTLAAGTPIDLLVLRDQDQNPVLLPMELKGKSAADIKEHLKQHDIEELQTLVVFNIDGDDFDDTHMASVSLHNQYAEQKAIGFSATERGAQILKDVTTKNLPDGNGFARHLGIVIDDRLVSAPKIQAEIGQNGMISGNYGEHEVEDLIAVLRAGRLPFELEPDPVNEDLVGESK